MKKIDREGRGGEPSDHPLRRSLPTALGAMILSRLLPNLAGLLTMISVPRWATPTLFVLGVLSSFAEAVGIMLIPLFVYSMMNQLDLVVAGGGLLGSTLHYAIQKLHNSREIGLLFLLLIVARGALAYAYSLTTTYISEQMSQTTRDRVHSQYLRLPYSLVQQCEQADLAQTLGHEAWLPSTAYASLTRVLINITFIIILGILLTALSWKITLCVLLGSLLLTSVLQMLSGLARAIGLEAKRVHRDLWDFMMMTLQGMRTIRAFGQESFHQNRFNRGSDDARAIGIRAMKLTLLLDPLTEVGYLIILCAIVVATPHLGINFATTLTCVALLYRLQPHVRELEGHRLNLLQLEPQLASVRTILEAKRDVDNTHPIDITALQRGISFQHVTFRYQPDGPPVLNHATFSIPAGCTTAFVGASGSGKTSVVNLLLRLYQPTGGIIRVDDVPLDAIDRKAWLKLIAVAGQDVDLVEGTVLENIRMADIDATEQAVVSSAQLVELSDLLESLPGGYTTRTGQQGLRFSGGQRQRIGLARAALRCPSFLILDEAMSEMEFAMEERLHASLRVRFPQCTMLIITHRLETVQRADYVIYIKDGEVRTEGNPDEILKQLPSL